MTPGANKVHSLVCLPACLLACRGAGMLAAQRCLECAAPSHHDPASWSCFHSPGAEPGAKPTASSWQQLLARPHVVKVICDAAHAEFLAIDNARQLGRPIEQAAMPCGCHTAAQHLRTCCADVMEGHHFSEDDRVLRDLSTLSEALTRAVRYYCPQ